MRVTTSLALGLLVAMSAVACGSDSKDPKVASANSGKPTATVSASPTGKTDEKEAMLKFAQCMRQNGVPEFPDPKFGSGGGISLDLPPGVDRAKVDGAQDKCKSLLPNGGEADRPIDPKMEEQLRQYAKCIRENGIPNFPDPKPGGGLQIDNNALGLTPDDPRMKTAMDKCNQLAPKPPNGEGGASNNVQNGSGA
ncbi:hypothetical protein [Yinghuangia seranimata]|uniref:hypothetical protein n=1 Tax=Yinghuangia seranimata TaxID=408067 RepID=UPI00248C953F|nr:hypothetical protein [Yinghuangia seranimata]MDI2131996.1 hypothetical protein [Yinghuangia seranimata]